VNAPNWIWWLVGLLVILAVPENASQNRSNLKDVKVVARNDLALQRQIRH